MDRRDFLNTGLIGVGLGGCVRQGSLLDSPPPPMSDAEVQRFLQRLDGQMTHVATAPPMHAPWLEQAAIPEPARKNGEALAKKAIRSLLLAGSFTDLPLEGRVHPDVQTLVQGHMTEMDEATTGMRAYLEGLTPTERSDISRALQSDPNLGMRIVESIDVEAAKIGVTLQRRTHLRQVAAHTCGRLRQSSGLFVDSMLRKVTKIAEYDTGAVAAERRLLASLGEDKVGQLRHDAEAAMDRWRVAQAGTRATDGYPIVTPPPPKRGTALLTVGGLLLGFGAIHLTFGLVFISAGPVLWIFGLTLGAMLIIAGIVLLIVGAVLRARS